MSPNMQSPSIFDDSSRSPTKPSVLRAIWSSKSHKRNSSADDAFASRASHTSHPGGSPYTPADRAYPLLDQHPLAEIAPNRDSTDVSSAPRSPGKHGKNTLHKKTKSAVSLKSLKSYMERKDKSDDPPDDEAANLKPKKAKSANSLSAILKRSQRGRKAEGSKNTGDKENRSPSDPVNSMPSPVWHQSATSSYPDPSAATSSHHKRSTMQEEVSLYMPREYGPTLQRNIYDYQKPSLRTRADPKPRPKSDYLAEKRKGKELLDPFGGVSPDKSPAIQPVPASAKKHGRPRAQSRPEYHPPAEPKPESSPKRVSRVQAAISAFNAKGQEAEAKKPLNGKELESEFEKLLDARNIPHNMRDKMRSLDTNIKADFIRKDRAENTPHSASASGTDSTGRRGRRKEQKEDQQSQDGKGSRSRSRSRGFTFSKGSSSPKKQRPDSGSFYRRPKSADFSQPTGFSKIGTPSTSTTSLSATACDTAADPSDFVHYLREIQKPEMVEVGKMHKLRLLLRNETVSWVDTFIADGGMDEIVQLLYRIMKVEWREEHEDNLLHETLLCLKALCTTSIALQHLNDIEDQLFPALLKMLFDDEKKGPSEYTTRGIIMNLFFTQLSAVSSDEMAARRAARILSYLRDPSPPEDNQPLSFIANIYQSRPYRIWLKEISNVTKEVFWIFLHHLNVIPIAKDDKPYTSFREHHFPSPRPPVPAAPYVGGVEWDATNYLAAHLDLLNGLVASLATVEERNQLRAELRASGFEKVMGGTLRTCKVKFYSSVHDCLKTWVAAAVEDGWPYLSVREGPPRPEPGSPTKSPTKAPGSPKKGFLDEQPPKLELALDVPASSGASPSPAGMGNWL
ncbi:GTPase binding protein Rid1 [Aspergillus heteromorphus CBS 117.55]|uniref:GTPase binding protein Rid1 n=1 Tax=Aspergillus heteromorphus CBS 117.55 TaxID=1448321 RepID=A0A317WME2_9EURO|nr:GTPase binding protein Rid1 [Aspergillus heteromorphus CBS 117.55]PWY87634.1 GTPase binding protein Rid1 [Aspergillus heteromorphus CBS 117.55]